MLALNLNGFQSLAGTAILSKHKALSVNMTLPGHPDPSTVKGRIVTLEFETFYLIGTYVVNAGVQLKVGQMTQNYSIRSKLYMYRPWTRKKSGTRISMHTFAI